MELLRQPLPNSIRAPPLTSPEFQLERGENLLRRVLQIGECDGAGLRAGGELDVEADEGASFAGDDEEIARGCVQGGFAADVGEGGVRVDVHDAPDGVGGVTEHGEGEGFTDYAVGAVASLGIAKHVSQVHLLVYSPIDGNYEKK